jgi:murein L,D-transpeptidase YcbB/YkuD
VRVTTAMRRTLITNAIYGPIAPIAGTYRRERPADLRAFRCIAANAGAIGVSYWSLQHTRRSQMSSLALPTTCTDAEKSPRTYPTTRLGARGDTVVWLQSRLRAWGSPVPRTGYFLRRTRNAVRSFQRAHGLETTGVVDPRTWDLLLQRSG